MRKKIYLYCLLSLLSGQAISQTQSLYISPIRYTATYVTVNGINSSCYGGTGIQLYVNDVAINASQNFCVYGICKFAFPFGTLAVGDKFYAKDGCGNTSNIQYVQDDFVYVETPANGFSSTDASPPYSKLATAYPAGKCSPIAINAHALYQFTAFFLTNGYSYAPFTSGVFKINGTPITASDVTVDYNGISGSNFTLNNGAATYNASVYFTTNTFFSGLTPVSIEYAHNGVLAFNDQEYFFGPIGVRIWDNNHITAKQFNYDGSEIDTDYYGTYTNSVFKLTFDSGNFKLYVDNNLIKTISRTVAYTTSSGTISNSSVLPYTTGVTWTPSASGQQWVGALIDGIRYTRQQFTVADDMSINPTVTNVACNGGNTGSIVVNVTGGMAPIQYALDNLSYVSSNSFYNLPPGSHTINVRDASGCTTSRTVSINANSLLSLAKGSVSDAICYGTSNGSVSLTASGGVGPYQYNVNGGAYQSSNTFSNLGSGTYSFGLKDAAGCTAQVSSVTVGYQSKLDVPTVTPSSVTCNGGTNGSLLIAMPATSQPSGSYQYSIDNGSTFSGAGTFSNLSSATYTIVVKDNLCSVSTNGTVSQPAALQFSPAIAVQNVSCNGLSNGSIVAVGTGGTGNLSYSIDNSTFVSSGTFSNLGAGNYKVWLKDINGCQLQSSILSITQPTALSINVQGKTDVTCYGGTNGSATLSSNGGTSPYSYSIGTSNYGTNPTINGLSATTYSIKVTDNQQCTATTNVQILQANDIVISPTVSKTVLCNGGNNGEIQVSASGGTGTLQYSLMDANYGSNTTFFNLAANTYTVWVQDASGCKKQSSPQTVSQPSVLIPVVDSLVNVRCHAGSDGVVKIGASGGVGNYTFSKDGSNFQTSGIFSGFTTNTYTFTVKDGNSCSQTIAATVSEPTLLVPSVSITQQVLCYNGTSGIITGSANGGTLPYQYSKDGSNFSSNPVFNGLPIGNYQVTVKDANGCSQTTTSVTLTQPTDLVPSIAANSAVKCNGGSDGVITLAASGGASGYQYSKDGNNFQASTQFSNLSAGNYVFSVKDANQCVKTIAGNVSQPANAYSITLASQTNLSCYQNQTGVLQVSNAGGTPPYQLSLDNTTFQTGTVFTNLAAGTYTVYGKDANNCTFALANNTLTQPTDISISLLRKLDVDCQAYQKGEALLLATGSNGGFSYSLSGYDYKNNPIVPINNTSGLFQNLYAGDYTLRATDQVGCWKDHTVTIIPKSTNINFNVTTTLPSTCQASDGSISIINASGGHQPYQYGISTQSAYSSSPTFSNLLGGTYYVTVADELCSYRQAVDLRFPNGITAGYTISPINCSTPDANVAIQPITGGNGGYQLAIDGGALGSSNTFYDLHPNLHYFLIQDTPLTCKTILSVEVKEQNRADLTLTGKTNILCYKGTNGVITVQGTNNLSPFQYALNNGAWQGSGTFANLSAGTYKLSALNSIGCGDSLRVTLTQPTALADNVTKKDNLCFGDTSGEIYTIGSGGVAPYQYSTDGANYQTNTNFTGKTAGTYTVYLKDANACIQTQNITLVQPSNVIVSPINQDTVRCYGEANGSILVKASGGTPDYVYSKDGTNYSSNNLFTNLVKGTYTLYVKDNNQCVRSNTLAINQPDSLKISLANKTNPLCYKQADGTITVNTSGGNGGNLFTANGLNPQSSNYINKLADGAYIIAVTDRKGCTVSTSSIQLTQPAQLQNTVTGKMPLCYGESNGSFTVKVTGGTPMYRADFSGITYQPNANNEFVFTNQPSKTHTLTVYDQNNCALPISYQLPQPTKLDNRITIKNNDCNGDSTGKIQVVGLNATPPYRYALDSRPLELTGIYDKLKAGNYLVTVLDSNGCTLLNQVQVIQPTRVVLTPIYQDTIKCHGDANGSIRILARGGTPGYVFAKDSTNGAPNFYTDSTFTGLKVNTYNFLVKDSHQCPAQTSLRITEPQVLKLSLLSKVDPLCLGDANGIINLTSTGGNGGNVYWRDNAYKATIGIFDSLSQGDYTFKVIDRKACQDTVTLVHLQWPKGLTASILPQSPTCFGDTNGKLTITPSGGIGNYKAVLQQQNTQNISDSLGNNFVFQNLKAGSYTVDLRDGNQCRLLLTQFITDAQALNPIHLGTKKDSTVCIGQEIQLDANNDASTNRIQWYLNNNLITNDSSRYYLASQTGTYKAVVTNPTGCSVSDTLALKNSNTALHVDFLMTVQAFSQDTVYVFDITKPKPDKWVWTLPSQAYSIFNNNTEIAFAIKDTSTYSITLTAFKGTCQGSKTYPLKIFARGNVGQTDPALHYSDLNLISSMDVSPNPNYGTFTVTAQLSRISDVTLSITRSATSSLVYKTTDVGKDNYSFPISLTNFMQDVYVITLQAGSTVMVKKVVLMN